jgi:hypothetical protein
MSRGRITHNVNASLIHEARMIIQQFLGGRQENYYSMKIAEAQAKVQQRPPVCLHTVLRCSFCDGTPAEAKFVINGYSACGAHEGKARSTTNTPRLA